MSTTACCKGSKSEDGSCTLTKTYFIDTPDGKKECECTCRCRNTSGKDCVECVCNCVCTLETAQKIVTADGAKYRCECSCEC